MTARPVPSEDEVLARLVEGGVAARVAGGDLALWPRVARPGWTGAVRAARPLVGEIAALAEQRRVAGQVRVLLATAGGAGVAAEALAGSDPRLVVLDTTDPPQVADALAGELAETVLVVSVPPGEDPQPVRLLLDTVHAAFRAEGVPPEAHTVVVTPPDGPLLPAGASPDGPVVVLGPDDVDGPWAAFTAYALVPAGLAGVDVGGVLEEAAAVRAELGAGTGDAGGDHAALALGALLASAPALALAAPDEPALAEWAAQLVAGGLGKDGHGPLPVVVEGPGAPEWVDLPAVGIGDVPGAALTTRGSVAEQMATWQHAVAAAAHVLGVDPTDRPDAHDAAAAARGGPAFTEGGVEVHAGDWLPDGTATVADALRALVGPDDGDIDGAGVVHHLAVHAYLDRIEDASAAVLRAELARRTGLPTTFGWAPRCLPGSGQHAKGGPPAVRVCQLTADPDDPGLRPEAADALAAVQEELAGADAAALTARGRPVLRLHFTDRVAGLVTVARAVQQL
ncbi:glucose-6-phosphate isomerase [Pseudonocardia adelaidensis]|uniref:Glucose-6-phosphate isomerase n=1 Tax=Pseudonocardia adelaidensis TaxID=648754 RepID=A0ABP9NHD5_9PSEU